MSLTYHQCGIGDLNDSFKLLDDSDAMPVRKASNLAKTLAHLIHKGWLSLAVIKVIAG